MSSEVLISRSCLLHNLRVYKSRVKKPVMVVVKSEAYGHGLILTSRAIESSTDWFGVVSGEEALRLRAVKIKKSILVLSFFDDRQIPELLKNKISLVVFNINRAKLISSIAKKLKLQAKVHLKVDSGTSRLGILPKHLAQLADKIIKLPNINIEGVFSHFAASEENVEFTRKQNHIFDTVVEELEWRGQDPIKHIACTAAGIISHKNAHDLVRLGIGLYGLWPSSLTRRKANFKLKPALTWQTTIIQVKDLPKGTNVGYGLTFTTKRPTRLAVLPVGYFDGYDRKLSNSGVVLIHGQRCRIIGRICMNLTMVDVTDLSQTVRIGDKVVLIGRYGKEEISVDEIAQKIGTINYEVVSRINPLIERRIV